jgi:hypothetical protein
MGFPNKKARAAGLPGGRAFSVREEWAKKKPAISGLFGATRHSDDS